MYRYQLLKPLTIFLACFLFLGSSAQKKAPVIGHGIDENGNEFEITTGYVEEKQPTDNSSQQPKYDGGPLFQLFKFIQGLTNTIFGVQSTAGNNGREYESGTVALLLPAHEKNFWAIGVGAGITQKGSKYKFPGGTTKVQVWYVEVPQLKLRYGIPADAGTFLLDLNPYYAIAVSGKTKSFTGASTELKFGNGFGNNFQRSDWGFKFGASFRLRSVPVLGGVFYDLGLGNISPIKDIKTHNRGIGVQVGVQL